VIYSQRERRSVDIKDAYKFFLWLMKGLELFAPAPDADLAALQREINDTRPLGIRIEPFMHSAMLYGTGRSVCATASEDLGRVPFGARAGDLVCIFKGGVVPYLLRPDNGHYRLVGECYINRMMYGQALDRTDLVDQEFKII
jgi:hypothetical protein